METIVVLADFSLDQEASKPIKEAMRDKDIGFLVNCVDESLNSPHSLIEMPEQSLLDLVNKNVAVATLMTWLVLPGMVERSRGAVINISSGACCRPLPGRVTLIASTVRQNTVDINLFLPEYFHKSSTIHKNTKIQYLGNVSELIYPQTNQTTLLLLSVFLPSSVLNKNIITKTFSILMMISFYFMYSTF